jgi:hypothetical protein
LSTCNYVGLAPIFQQSEYNNVTTFTSTHTYPLTFTDLENGGTSAVTATLPAGLTDTASAATYIVSIYKQSGKAKFDEASFAIYTTLGTSYIIVKARQPGRPFTVAWTAGTGTWGTSFSLDANSGPNDWSCPANYAENAAPASGDNVILHGTASPLYNTYQSGTTFGKFDTSLDWSGRTAKIIGGWTAVRQRGAGQLLMDVGSSNIAITVDNTAALANNALASEFYGSNIASLYVAKGNVGLAPFGGVTTTCATITNNSGYLVVGSGVTATTVHSEGDAAITLLGCACTTLNSIRGKVTTDGSGAITTVNQYVSNLVCNSSGTIATLNMKAISAGSVDWSGRAGHRERQPARGCEQEHRAAAVPHGREPAARDRGRPGDELYAGRAPVGRQPELLRFGVVARRL